MYCRLCQRNQKKCIIRYCAVGHKNESFWVPWIKYLVLLADYCLRFWSQTMHIWYQEPKLLTKVALQFKALSAMSIIYLDLMWLLGLSVDDIEAVAQCSEQWLSCENLQPNCIPHQLDLPHTCPCTVHTRQAFCLISSYFHCTIVSGVHSCRDITAEKTVSRITCRGRLRTNLSQWYLVLCEYCFFHFQSNSWNFESNRIVIVGLKSHQ